MQYHTYTLSLPIHRFLLLDASTIVCEEVPQLTIKKMKYWCTHAVAKCWRMLMAFLRGGHRISIPPF